MGPVLGPPGGQAGGTVALGVGQSRAPQRHRPLSPLQDFPTSCPQLGSQQGSPWAPPSCAARWQCTPGSELGQPQDHYHHCAMELFITLVLKSFLCPVQPVPVFGSHWTFYHYSFAFSEISYVYKIGTVFGYVVSGLRFTSVFVTRSLLLSVA